MMTIRLEGLKRLKENAARVKRSMRRDEDDAASSTAEDTRAWLVESIMKRRLSLQVVSEAWEARKAAGEPELVNTHGYVDAMMVRRTSKGSFTVTVPDKLQLRALWLEFGTSKMPPRPHWRPAADQAEQEIAPRVGARVLTGWAKELAR